MRVGSNSHTVVWGAFACCRLARVVDAFRVRGNGSGSKARGTVAGRAGADAGAKAAPLFLFAEDDGGPFRERGVGFRENLGDSNPFADLVRDAEMDDFREFGPPDMDFYERGDYLAPIPHPMMDSRDWYPSMSLSPSADGLRQLPRPDYPPSPQGARGAYNSPQGGSGQWWESGQQKAYGAIQGNSRTTFQTPSYSGQSRIFLETPNGRPLDTEVELWDGPNNSPTKMKVYSEDGTARPFQALVETPANRMGRSNVVSVRNSGPLEFPMSAGVNHEMPNGYGNDEYAQELMYMPKDWKHVQGGALKTFTLDHSVGSVLVSIETDGLPMNSKVELWGTGSHVKQVAEVYNDDGNARPFNAVVEVPGGTNTICVKNTGPVEYPMRASVIPLAPERYDSHDNESGGYGDGNYGGFQGLGGTAGDTGGSSLSRSSGGYGGEYGGSFGLGGTGGGGYSRGGGYGGSMGTGGGRYSGVGGYGGKQGLGGTGGGSYA